MNKIYKTPKIQVFTLKTCAIMAESSSPINSNLTNGPQYGGMENGNTSSDSRNSSCWDEDE